MKSAGLDVALVVSGDDPTIFSALQVCICCACVCYLVVDVFACWCVVQSLRQQLGEAAWTAFDPIDYPSPPAPAPAAAPAPASAPAAPAPAAPAAAQPAAPPLSRREALLKQANFLASTARQGSVAFGFCWLNFIGRQSGSVHRRRCVLWRWPAAVGTAHFRTGLPFVLCVACYFSPFAFGYCCSCCGVG